MVKTPGKQLERIAKKYDRAIASSETETQQRIEAALDSSYKQLEGKLRKSWDKYSNENQPNLLGSQRSLLLLQEVKEYMQLFRPQDAATIEQEFQQLLTTSTNAGVSMASELMGAIAGDSFVKSTVSVNVAAVKFQAEEGRKRLSRHSDDFANRASAIVEMSLVQGWGVGKASGLLRRELGATKGKAEQIVRTESMSSRNRATKETYETNGIEQVCFVATSDDRLCPYCAARAGKVYTIGKISPPLHPSCRCYLMPDSKVWRDLGLIDTEWVDEHRRDAIEQAGGTNNGVAPFEKAAGLTEAPKPIDVLESGNSGGDNKPKSDFDINQSNKPASERVNISELEKLGKGAFGTVYDLGDDKVIKVSQFDIDPIKMKQEADMQQKAAEAGLAPKIYEIGRDYIVMDKVGKSLDSEKVDFANIGKVPGVEDLIKKLNDIEIGHHDIHSGNIARSLDGKSLLFLDFGFATPYVNKLKQTFDGFGGERSKQANQLLIQLKETPEWLKIEADFPVVEQREKAYAKLANRIYDKEMKND